MKRWFEILFGIVACVFGALTMDPVVTAIAAIGVVLWMAWPRWMARRRAVGIWRNARK